MFYLVLFLVLGILTHLIKKVAEARLTSSEFQLHDYLHKYPYRTFLTVIAGVVGFATLLAAGELTMITAFMTGYMANSLGGAGVTTKNKEY